MADYWITMEEFPRIEERYRPFSADYFASDRSWRKKLFFAKFGVSESRGLDAFSCAGREEWCTFILQLVWCGKWFARRRERELKECSLYLIGQEAVSWRF